MRSISLLLLPALLFPQPIVNNNGSLAYASLFSQTASVTVANTTTETSVISAGVGLPVIPANFLQPGMILLVRTMGVHSAVNPNPRIRWTVKLGTKILLDSGFANSDVTTNQVCLVDALITVRSIGVSGSVFAQGTYNQPGGYNAPMSNTAPITINTTVPNTVDITVQHNKAAPGNTATVSNAVITVLAIP